MNRSQKVLVVGSANADLCVNVDHLPKPGETVLGGEYASASGGKGANQAVGAARAGADVTFIGRIGCDPFGEQLAAALAADGICIDHVVRDRTSPTGVALISIDRAGENCIAVAPGANARLSPSDLKRARNSFAAASVVLLQLEIPMETVEAAATLAAAAGAKILLNPAPARMLPAALLKNISVLTPNESEAELLTGIRLTDRAAVISAAEALLEKGVRNVAITLGPRGAYVAGKGGGQWIAGHKVKAVDSTAAGDIFNGALAAAMARGNAFADAIKFANAAAAISVTRQGAQPSAPTRSEIDQWLAAADSRNGHASLRALRRTQRAEA